MQFQKGDYFLLCPGGAGCICTRGTGLCVLHAQEKGEPPREPSRSEGTHTRASGADHQERGVRQSNGFMTVSIRLLKHSLLSDIIPWSVGMDFLSLSALVHRIKCSHTCNGVCTMLWKWHTFSLFHLQLCDFAKLSQNAFYVYNDIEHFKDEPHIVSILSEEDIHVTEEIYKRALFTLPSYRWLKHGFQNISHFVWNDMVVKMILVWLYPMICHRYYRLPLPMEGAPLEETFDAFISVLRVWLFQTYIFDPRKLLHFDNNIWFYSWSYLSLMTIFLQMS